MVTHNWSVFYENVFLENSVYVQLSVTLKVEFYEIFVPHFKI